MVIVDSNIIGLIARNAYLGVPYEVGGLSVVVNDEGGDWCANN
ncbi:hypothetical protein [Marinimicrobium sp. C2-29]